MKNQEIDIIKKYHINHSKPNNNEKFTYITDDYPASVGGIG